MPTGCHLKPHRCTCKFMCTMVTTGALPRTSHAISFSALTCAQRWQRPITLLCCAGDSPNHSGVDFVNPDLVAHPGYRLVGKQPETITRLPLTNNQWAMRAQPVPMPEPLPPCCGRMRSLRAHHLWLPPLLNGASHVPRHCLYHRAHGHSACVDAGRRSRGAWQ